MRRPLTLVRPTLEPLATDYQAVNARGVVVYAFNDFERAKAFVRESAGLHVGLHLEAVERWETRRVVYRPRPQAVTP